MAEAIRRRWPGMRVVHLPDYEGLAKELPNTDIFVGYSLRAKQLPDALKLKWVHSTASGVAQLMYPELRESGIVVTNPRGIFAVPMAEHTMGLLLALARNFPDAVRQQDKQNWGQQEIWDRPQRLTELNGKTLLLVGFGSIGQEIALRAKVFGMKIWAVNRSGHGDNSLTERIVPISKLAEVLSLPDFVVIAAPETTDTKKLIGARELALMKPGARLINVSRGSLLDEEALVTALETGKLGGAALDGEYDAARRGRTADFYPVFRDLSELPLTPVLEIPPADSRHAGWGSGPGELFEWTDHAESGAVRAGRLPEPDAAPGQDAAAGGSRLRARREHAGKRHDAVSAGYGLRCRGRSRTGTL